MILYRHIWVHICVQLQLVLAAISLLDKTGALSPNGSSFLRLPTQPGLPPESIFTLSEKE